MNLLQQLISTFMLLMCTDKTRNLRKHTAFPKLFHSEETTGQASVHWHQEEKKWQTWDSNTVQMQTM
jgi:hypothetical protein